MCPRPPARRKRTFRRHHHRYPVTDVTPPADRARTQGLVDLPVALAGAAGGLSSGVIVATAGYAALSLGAAALALLIPPLARTTARARTTAVRQ